VGSFCSLCGSTDPAGLGSAIGICLDATACHQRQYAKLRDRADAAEAKLAEVRAALRRHVPSFTDPRGVVLCGGCLLAAPCPDAALAGEGSA
jgi:hypothetical protein